MAVTTSSKNSSGLYLVHCLLAMRKYSRAQAPNWAVLDLGLTDGLYSGHMLLAPIAQGTERLDEFRAKFRHRVLHTRGDFMEHLAVKDAIPFQFAKVLSQHLSLTKGKRRLSSPKRRGCVLISHRISPSICRQQRGTQVPSRRCTVPVSPFISRSIQSFSHVTYFIVGLPRVSSASSARHANASSGISISSFHKSDETISPSLVPKIGGHRIR